MGEGATRVAYSAATTSFRRIYDIATAHFEGHTPLPHNFVKAMHPFSGADTQDPFSFAHTYNIRNSFLLRLFATTVTFVIPIRAPIRAYSTMVFSIDITFSRLGVRGNNTDGNTPDGVETNAGNRQGLALFRIRTNSTHDVSAIRDIHATHEVLKFEFVSPVRDVETLHSNINSVFKALHVLSSRPDSCRVFTTLLDCYKLAGVAILHNLGTVLQDAPQPIYGPRPRPLPQAAVFQNLNSRVKRLLVAIGVRDRYHVNQPPPVGITEPIRYDDAYDNMLGTRSIDDGTAAAYAYRDGAEATNELRFRQGWHNGLPFGQDHGHITTLDRYLVEARQARRLAGLSTRAMDVEIAIRAVRDTNSWGWVGMSLLESRMMAREFQLTYMRRGT